MEEARLLKVAVPNGLAFLIVTPNLVKNDGRDSVSESGALVER